MRALLDTRQAAEFLNMSKSWMETLRSQGRGPHVVRLGHRALYRVADLEKFVEDNVEQKSMTK